MRKVFVDTAPFIYLIEGHPQFASKVERYFDDGVDKDLVFVSSVITYLEF